MPNGPLFGEKDYLKQTLWLLVSDAINAHQPDNPSLFVNCTYSNGVACIATFTVTVKGVFDLPPSIQVDGKVSIPIELSIPAEDLLQADIYIPDLKELAQSFAAPFENIFRLFLGPLGSWISSLIDSAIAQIKANSGPSGYAGHSGDATQDCSSASA